MFHHLQQLQSGRFDSALIDFFHLRSSHCGYRNSRRRLKRMSRHAETFVSCELRFAASTGLTGKIVTPFSQGTNNKRYPSKDSIVTHSHQSVPVNNEPETDAGQYQENDPALQSSSHAMTESGSDSAPRTQE